MSSFSVSPYSGKTVRIAIKDCAGDWVHSGFTSIQYTIYFLDFGERVPVVGHTGVSIPLTSLFPEPQTSADTENQFNFEYRISGAQQLPFAVLGQYLVVFSFYVGAEPYVCEVSCISE